MKIHKEGTNTIVVVCLFLLALNSVFFLCKFKPVLLFILGFGSCVFLVFILQFFRSPERESPKIKNACYSPSDGKVVSIEETTETEYFKDKRIQIAVFMAATNVHINWAPLDGEIVYHKHHPGPHVPAWLPKSSQKNEHNSFVIQTVDNKQVLARQIAGIVARRIVFYPKKNEYVEQGNQIGFIKFGSRVDVFLPLDAKINVKIGEKVKGTQTILAHI